MSYVWGRATLGVLNRKEKGAIFIFLGQPQLVEFSMKLHVDVDGGGHLAGGSCTCIVGTIQKR